MTGFFVVIDGPSGIGKTTVVQLLARRLADSGHCIVVTREPSPGPIGALARSGTQQFRGVALACLVTADRYHHIETEIRPALAAGNIVICDRYLPSSLVLQHLDGVPGELIWKLNAEIERPDLTILLDGDPKAHKAAPPTEAPTADFMADYPEKRSDTGLWSTSSTPPTTRPAATTSANRAPTTLRMRSTTSSTSGIP